MNADKEYMVEPLNDYMGYYFCSNHLLCKEKTEYQLLEIHEVPEYGRILRLDGILQTSNKDEFLYHEILVHVPAITMDGPQKALLIGGGDGGGIKEILKYPSLKKVVMVELDECVVERSKEFLPKISNGAFESEKLELHIQNGLEYVRNNAEMDFDQVVLDLTDAFSFSLSLYTKEFYKQVKKTMTRKGVLSLHIESPITMSENFRRIYWTLKSAFKFVRPMLNYIPLYGSLWGFATASDHYDPAHLSINQISKRLKAHELKDLKFYNAQTHQQVQCIPPYIQELIQEPAPIITKENKNSVREVTRERIRISAI